MNTLQDIFDNMKGEWDNFGHLVPKEELKLTVYEDGLIRLRSNKDLTFVVYYSLADLLANKSWCIAVWGEDGMVGEYCRKPHEPKHCGDYDCRNEVWQDGFNYHSVEAFQIHQQQGQQECIDYIIKTME